MMEQSQRNPGRYGRVPLPRVRMPTKADTIPEELTLPAIQRRLDRACKTIRALPDKERRWLDGSSQGIWRQMVRDFRENYGYEDVKIRFNPTPFDVTDCLIALGWCTILDRSEFEMIWWRSFPNVSFGVIAARIGRSDETARQRHYQVLLKVWAHALNEKTDGPARHKHGRAAANGSRGTR